MCVSLTHKQTHYTGVGVGTGGCNEEDKEQGLVNQGNIIKENRKSDNSTPTATPTHPPTLVSR